MALLSQWKNKSILTILVSLFLVCTAHAAKDLQPEIKFDQAEIQIGKKKITVDMAVTPSQHEKGLMYRDSLPENGGMLFVFTSEDTLNFWMKNTYVDLSIAYINKKMKIIDIQEMKATSSVEMRSPKTYPSAKPAMYALEMPKGWFKKNNIIIGQTLKLPKKDKE